MESELILGAAMRIVAIYSRVSTDQQSTENQERELREVAERAGWNIVQIYRDEGVSGAKSRESRPGFDALCKDVARRRFDMVMAWSVDRLGRSLQDLVGFLSELHALGIDLFLHQQGLDTTTPAGKAMFQMMGVFAEFDRSMIRERVNAGLRGAKAAGKKLGRRRLEDDKNKDRRAVANAVRAALQEGGVGIRKVAARHGVGVGTVLRIKADMQRPLSEIG
jgi:DNA invertase Pin-like site-specific DNA recombinase